MYPARQDRRRPAQQLYMNDEQQQPQRRRRYDADPFAVQHVRPRDYDDGDDYYGEHAQQRRRQRRETDDEIFGTYQQPQQRRRPVQNIYMHDDYVDQQQPRQRARTRGVPPGWGRPGLREALGDDLEDEWEAEMRRMAIITEAHNAGIWGGLIDPRRRADIAEARRMMYDLAVEDFDTGYGELRGA